GDPPSLLLTERDMVALSADAAEVDVALFEQLSGSSTPDDLARAVAFYRGPLLDGIKLRESAFDEWLTQERTRLHELAVAVLGRLADAQARRGEVDAATASLERALVLDPISEATHRQLMQLQLDRGLY